MNTTDPNVLVEQVKHEVETKPTEAKPAPATNGNGNGNGNVNSAEPAQQNRGGRVPPGGFSSGGFW